MSPPVLILHIISAVLGTWSSTLLWRLALERRERRRARPGVQPAIAFTPGQRLFGTIMIIICLPGSVAGMVVAEWISVAEGGGSGGGGRYGPRDAAAVAVAALMLMLAGGAGCAGIFFDPPRGRRRCPTCWYQLEGIDLSRCPECGRDQLPESDLYRTRRSRGLLAASLALFLVAGSFYFVRLAMGGKAASLVPTSLMISMLPSLPIGMVQGDSGCLTDRVENDNLSTAQLEQLEKRCREIIITSSDVELILRVVPLHRTVALHGKDVPKVTAQTAATILKPLFSSNREIAYLARDNWREMERYLPARLDPPEAGVILPLVLAAMTSPDRQERDLGYPVSLLLGKPGAVLIPVALRVVRDRSRDFGERAAAATLLAAQTAHSTEAWDELRNIVAWERELLRFVPGEGSAQMLPDYALVEPKLTAALDDDFDEVAAWAGKMIVLMDPDRAARMPRLIALMDARPGVTPLLIDLLAQYLTPEQALKFAERLLNTSDHRSHDVGGRLCVTYAPYAERLLPRLHELRDSPARFASFPVLQAITAIEDHVARRLESEKETAPK